MSAAKRKRKPKIAASPYPKPLHPIDPYPSMRVRLHLLRRGTTPTDFGLDAIFAPRPREQAQEQR